MLDITNIYIYVAFFCSFNFKVTSRYLKSNLMWTFIELNGHQFTDSKAQLNKTNVNNHKSNNIARSYQEDTGVT